MSFSRFSKYKARLWKHKYDLLLGLIVLCFVGILARGNHGWGNETPKGEIVAQQLHLTHKSQVIPRAQETWLVRTLGSDLNYRPNPIPETATFLNALMDKTAETDYPWVISRLEQGKPMRDLAYFDGDSSLLVSPDSKTLVLLTDVGIPNQKYRRQDAVFRSDDQGETWRWLKEGFFPEASWKSSSMKFYMHGTGELWTWRDFMGADDGKTNTDPATWLYRAKAGNLYTELYYSPDFGENVEAIPIPKTLLYRFDEKDIERGINNYVAQLAPDRAMIWFSQHIPPIEDWGNISSVTTQIELRRVNNRWQMQAPRHFEGMAIYALHETGNRVMATIAFNDDYDDKKVAEFDPEQQNWKRVGELPNPFFPLSSSKGVFDLWAGENVLLLEAMIEYKIRWLYPFAWFDARKAKTISAPIEPYYSLDQGRSWKQLTIKPIAFQPEEGRIFWVQDHKLLSTVLGKNE